MRLRGRVALVTGAHGGIGKACAELFAHEGATVIAADINSERPDYAERNISYTVLDVADESGWNTLATEVLPDAGLDIVVNAAGIAKGGALHNITMEDWHAVIGVNQTGVMLGTQLGIRSMLKHGRGGSIVNISSIWGSVATDGFAAYHASKGAVVLISKNAAVTYGVNGIRANTIHPGLIRTPMSDGSPSEFNQQIIDVTPLRRKGEPEDVARGALYLASDDGAFVTGTSLFIDGGFTAL